VAKLWEAYGAAMDRGDMQEAARIKALILSRINVNHGK
jgi:hypothetical protein